MLRISLMEEIEEDFVWNEDDIQEVIELDDESEQPGDYLILGRTFHEKFMCLSVLSCMELILQS